MILTPQQLAACLSFVAEFGDDVAAAHDALDSFAEFVNAETESEEKDKQS